MDESIKAMNIYEKMQAITNEIGIVKKNLTVNLGKSSYKAVGEADVLEAVKELEKKYRIFSYPCARDIINNETLETTKTDYNGNEIKTNTFFLRIKVTYAFVNIDNPNEIVYGISYGDGMDTQDKATGKAMTYADKYALMKAYKITTGDDPDQAPSENFKIKKTTKSAVPKTIDINNKIGNGKYADLTWVEVYNQDNDYIKQCIDKTKDTNAKKVYEQILKDIEERNGINE